MNYLEKYCTAGQATDDNIIRACALHEGCLRLRALRICNTYALPLQERLHERASVLRYTYTVFPVQIKYQMQLLQSRCDWDTGAAQQHIYIYIYIYIYIKNQSDALIIQIYCYKTLHVSGIFFAHHQEFSTVHSALVSYMQVLVTTSKQSQDGTCWLYLEAVTKTCM
jgi:hypothetical protein